jgi:hypothetical protein
MYYEEIKIFIFNKKFLIFYLIIFIVLYVFCSFIKFLGQIPILIIITFIIAYYLNNIMSNKFDKLLNYS